MHLATPDPRQDRFYQPDALVGWSHIPDAQGRWGVWPEFSSKVRINSQGLRDREYSYHKPAGVYRVLVLGDSFVQGMQVPAAQTFPKVLEEILNRAGAGRRYEVINAGVAGYATDNELLFYREEAYRYEADLVLLAFYHGNDVKDNSIQLMNRDFRKPYFELEAGKLELRSFPLGLAGVLPDAARVAQANPIKRFLLGHSRLYLSTRELLKRSPLLFDILTELSVGDFHLRRRSDYEREVNNFEIYEPEYAPAWREAWELTGRELELLAALAGHHGSRFAVASMPDAAQIYPKRWQETLAAYPEMLGGRAWDLEKPDRLLAAMLAAQRIPLLLPNAAFKQQAEAGARLYNRLDGHFNANGHRLMAEQLASWLRSAELLD